MKKKSLWSYIGKLLIALILIALISLVGIFIFDRYNPSTDSFSNKYKDSYWDELKGFQTYDELKKGEAKYDLNSSEYVSPYDEDDTILEKIYKARYVEELDQLIKSLESRSTTIKNEITSLNKVTDELSKEEWIFTLLGISDSTDNEELYTKIANPSYEYNGSSEDFEKILANYKKANVYKQLVANGFKGQFSVLISALLTASDSEELYQSFNTTGEYSSRKEWIIDVCGFNSYPVDDDFSAYDFVVINGYRGTFNEWKTVVNVYLSSDVYTILSENDYLTADENDYDLYMAIYNDHGKKGIANSSAYEISTIKDVDKINSLQAEQAEINELVDIANQQSLPTLDEYFNRLQFVTGWSDSTWNVTDHGGKERYEFYFSKGLTTFKVVDNLTGYEWYSNPKDVEIKLKEDQNTILNIIYGTSAGAEIAYSNYTYAMTTIDSKGRAVDPNYAVNYVRDENGKITRIEVWYGLSKRGINYTYFPQYMTKDHVDRLLENNKKIAASGQKDSSGNVIPDIKEDATRYEAANKEYTTATGSRKEELEKILAETKAGYEAYGKWLESYYQLLSEDSEDGKERGYAFYEYNSGNFEFMSNIVMNNLYKWLYEWCGYTSSDLEEDNLEFDVENEVNDPSFEAAIVYEFIDDGLKVTVPGNSIREYGDYTICKLDILPYFTSTPEGVDGYTIIPDGSGSILEHDNGKANLYNPYIKRLYTTDLSVTSTTKEVENFDIMLPMYAVVNGNSAVIVEVGDSADSYHVASQLELRATTSGYGNLGETNNKNYFRAYLRESQKVYIGVYSKDPVQKFTNKILTEDIILNYNIIGNTDTDYTYANIAEIYREHLIERYPALSEKVDTTTKPVLDLDVIGAYTYKDNFAGISYNAKGTMTTYNELQQMIDTYKAIGIEYINVFYHGWRKEALVNSTFKKIKLNSLLGSKKQLLALTENSNVTIYPYVSFGEVNNYQESFGNNHYSTRDVIGEIITKYPYDLSTNTYAKTGKIQIISPHYYERFAQSLVDSYVKLFGSKTAKENNVGINSISIDKFGSALAGDYKKDNELFKTGAIRNQLKSLELISKQIENINLYQPYDYALQYVNHAKDIPYKSTQKEILDYSIPFYQLVINGLFDYSGESINSNIEEGTDYHIMKLIETGSNPIFTFTYDSSSELVRTDYNMYYNTEYSNWLEEVKTFYNELVELDIYSCRLVNHEKLDTNVYQVTYSDGAGKTIKIILNYSFSSVYIDGVGTVAAKSYKKVL